MENKTWEAVKQNYLQQVDAAIKEAGHSKTQEILDDVKSHLEQKYSELAPDEQTWEKFQKIITDMGPASDYAELLAENGRSVPGNSAADRRFVFFGLGILGIIAITAVAIWMIRDFHPFRITDKIDYPFVNDSNVIGKWVSVDFVAKPEDFKVGRKRWQGDLHLKEIQFFEDGTTNWCDSQWTKGFVLSPEDKTASQYTIKKINGIDYMFFEWKSGDYTIRHQKPRYYVLRKETGIDIREYYVQKAQQIVQKMMVWKQFDTVVEMFDPTMEAALPASKLVEVCAQLEQAGGAFRGISGIVRMEQQGSMTVVFVPCTWEHNELDFKIVFNSEGKVSGLWTVAPAPRQKCN
jgi:hypothetical protein